MPDASWPLWLDILIFIGCTIGIGISGTKLAGLADRLADRTGLGEAIIGGVVLGVGTSLAGITASVTAAIENYPAMAVSNAFGGIAAQTVFLAVADLCYRRVNLEHAAASVQNMLQAALLILLLAFVLMTMAGPDYSIVSVHPASVILFAVYAYGFFLVYRTSDQPMWRPTHTADTVRDVPDEEAQREHLPRLLALIGVSGVVVLVCGALVTHTAGHISERTGLSQSVVGALFVAVSTSLPELVTTIAAVRRGAVTLAVSDIVGGNAFDVLFICVADFAYVDGSIYHAAGGRSLYLGALAIVLNAVLLMGLIHRERRGIVNIGFESMAIIVIYLAGVILLFW